MSVGPSSTTCVTSAARPRASKRRSNGARLRRPVVRGFAGAIVGALLTTGCANFIGGKAADTLASAILNQNDPELVASGVPAYLLLVDGLIAQSPDNPAL